MRFVRLVVSSSPLPSLRLWGSAAISTASAAAVTRPRPTFAVRSAALDCEAARSPKTLVEELGLMDTVELKEVAAEDPVDHFTYWRGKIASRIDRFYVSTSLD